MESFAPGQHPRQNAHYHHTKIKKRRKAPKRCGFQCFSTSGWLGWWIQYNLASWHIRDKNQKGTSTSQYVPNMFCTDQATDKSLIASCAARSFYYKSRELRDWAEQLMYVVTRVLRTQKFHKCSLVSLLPAQSTRYECAAAKAYPSKPSTAAYSSFCTINFIKLQMHWTKTAPKFS